MTDADRAPKYGGPERTPPMDKPGPLEAAYLDRDQRHWEGPADVGWLCRHLDSLNASRSEPEGDHPLSGTQDFAERFERQRQSLRGDWPNGDSHGTILSDPASGTSKFIPDTTPTAMSESPVETDMVMVRRDDAMELEKFVKYCGLEEIADRLKAALESK